MSTTTETKWYTKAPGDKKAKGPYTAAQLVAWGKQGQLPVTIQLMSPEATGKSWIAASQQADVWAAIQEGLPIQKQLMDQRNAEAMIATQQYANAVAIQNRSLMTGGDRLVAGIATLFIPGLGQMIYGRIILGVLILLITLPCYILFFPGLFFHVLAIVHALCMNTKK